MLRTLNLVVAALQQLLDDVFNVFTHIAGLGQGRGIGHHKGHVQGARQGLRQQRLAGARGANQQNIALGQLHIVFFGFFFVAQTLVMVVHGDGQGSLRRLLANHIRVQRRLDFGWGGQITARLADIFARREFVSDDLVAKIYALITDKDRRTSNEFFDFMLTFTAERAVQSLFAGGAFFFGHG